MQGVSCNFAGPEKMAYMSMTQPGHMQAAPSLMMTTSGLKSLDESQEEQQINEDLRYRAGMQQWCSTVCIAFRLFTHTEGSHLHVLFLFVPTMPAAQHSNSWVVQQLVFGLPLQANDTLQRKR